MRLRVLQILVLTALLGSSRVAAQTRAPAVSPSIVREFYDAFQRAEFDRWDAIMADTLLLNSPLAFGVRGLKAFKDVAKQFTDLAYRIDLIDEHVALDAGGNGRGFVTFLLHWKHTKPFLGIAPTGLEGTSLETALFTIRNRMIIRLDVAVNSVDLAIYEWERGLPSPHSFHPNAIVVGVDRRQ